MSPEQDGERAEPPSPAGAATVESASAPDVDPEVAAAGEAGVELESDPDLDGGELTADDFTVIEEDEALDAPDAHGLNAPHAPHALNAPHAPHAPHAPNPPEAHPPSVPPRRPITMPRLPGPAGGRVAPAPLRPTAAPTPLRPTVEQVMAALRDEPPRALRAALERELALDPEAARRGLLEHEVGALLDRFEHDPEAATAAWERARAQSPGLRPNLWQLRRRRQLVGDHAGAADLLAFEAGLATSARERAELYVEQGQLLERDLANPEAAEAAYRSALVEDPASLAALMALERHALRRGDRAALGELLRLTADATAEPGRRVELLVELARFEEAAGTGDPLATLREALALGSGGARVVDEMMRMADAGVERGAARAIDDRLDALEARIALVGAGADPDSALRVVDLRRLQASFFRASDRERARTILDAALDRAADEPMVLLDLVDLAEVDARHGEAAGLLERARRVASPALARRLCLMQARALRNAGQEGEAAALERALGDEAELRALWIVERQERAVAAGDLASLAQATREEAALALAAGDARWASRSLAVAATLEARVGGEEGAIAALREALSLVPDDPVALDALDGLLARTGRGPERAQVLERKLALAPAQGEERASLLDELVRLRAERLGDVEGALEAARALCALRAGEQGAGPVIARVGLVEVLRGAARWPEVALELSHLADALVGLGATAEAARAQATRALVLLERLGDVDGARGALDAAVALDPGNPVAQACRRSVLASAGDWSGVAGSLRSEVDRLEAPVLVAPLLVALAQVLDVRLGRAEDAAAIWRELERRAPGDPIVTRIRVARLAAGSPTDDPAQLMALAGAGAAAGLRGQGWLTVAEQAEAAGDFVPAGLAFEESVAADGQAASHASLGLLRVAARGGDGPAVEAALARLAAWAAPGAVAALASEGARLAALRGDEATAQRCVDQALGQDPSLPAARLAHARLAARAGRFGELADDLAALARTTRDAALSGVLAARSGLLGAAAGRASIDPVPPTLGWAAAGGDLDVERIEELLRQRDVIAAARAVEAALDERADDVVLLELAMRIARAAGDRSGEARAAHALAVALGDSEQAAVLLRAAAPVLEAQGEAVAATQAWCALVSLCPQDGPVRERAIALLAAGSDEGAIEELCSEGLGHVTVAAERARLLVERGLSRVRAGRPRAAAGDLELAVAAAEPGTPDTRATPGTDDAEERGLLERLVVLHRALGDLAGMRATARRLAHLPPALADAAAPEPARVAQLLAGFGDPAGAIEELRARAQDETDPAARARIELQVALLARDAIGDPASARSALATALALDPLLLEALAALVPLCVRQEDLPLRDVALERTLRAVQRWLVEEPDDAAGYEGLALVLEWRGDEDGRQLATQAAAAIAGRPIPPRRGGLEPGRALPAELARGSLAVTMSGPAGAIWRAARTAAEKLLGLDPATLAVSRATRVNERAVPPEWQPLDRIARALAVNDYELHVVPAPARGCAVAGNCLVVGSAFAGAPGPDERFQLARKLVLLREGLGPLEQASDEQLALFFAALAHAAGARWMGPAVPEGALEEWTHRLGRVLDRKERRALAIVAPRFADLEPPAEWRRALLDGAAHIALAVAGDLAAALAELRLEAGSPAARALARHAVSEDLAAMRTAMGQRA